MEITTLQIAKEFLAGGAIVILLLFATAFLKEAFIYNKKTDLESNKSNAGVNNPIMAGLIYYPFSFLAGLFILTIVLTFSEHLYFYIKNNYFG